MGDVEHVQWNMCDFVYDWPICTMMTEMIQFNHFITINQSKCETLAIDQCQLIDKGIP